MMVKNVKYIIILLSCLLILTTCVNGEDIKIGEGAISLSSGDDAAITGVISDGSKSGQVWLYTGNYENLIYGQEPIIVEEKEFKVVLNKSLSLSSGKYKLFIQFNGANDVQEVLYNPKTTKLYSPWIYAKEEDVSNNIAAIPSKAEIYCKENIKYCDDTFYNTTISIDGPFIKFSDQYQVQNDQLDISKNSLLYVGGVTNIDPSNTINITLDYEQKVTAIIEGKNPNGYYKWYGYLNISRLRPGDHTILIESDKTDDMKSILTISEYIPTPIPTQVPIKYVRNEQRDFVSVTNVPPTVKPTGTPIIIGESGKQFVPLVTDTPQEAPSGAVFIKPTATNIINTTYAPEETSGKLPINTTIPIFALILSIYIIKRQSDKV